MEPPEHLTDFNRQFQPLVKILYQIRTIEHSKDGMSNKFKKAKRLLTAVYRILELEKDFVLYRIFWEELHDRMSYYYNYLNTVNLKTRKIPLYRVTLHNEVVSWWLASSQNKKLKGPLMHFDTHDDMGLPNNPHDLLDPKGKLKIKNLSEKGSCRKINYPVTCMLLSKKVNKVFWLMPAWVYDDNRHYEQYLAACKKDVRGICWSSDILYLRQRGQVKDNFMLTPDVEIVDKEFLTKKYFSFLHKFDFYRQHTDKLIYWKKLAEAIKPDKYFILDIDLDYFVTNGDKVTRAIYMKDFNDIESFKRTHIMPGVISPQELYEDVFAQKIKKMINLEVKAIDCRIKVFLRGLAYLKKQGIKPSVINFSDSSPAMLTADHTRASYTNNYCPKYFVPYLHTKLIRGFKKLYPNNFL